MGAVQPAMYVIVSNVIVSQPLLTMRVDEQDIKKLTDEQYFRMRNDYSGSKQVSVKY